MRLVLLPPVPDNLKPLLATTRKFIAEQVAPFALADDREANFRREAFNRAAALGLTALPIARQHGGAGAGSAAYYGVIEEVARVSPSLAIVIGVTNLIQGGLVQFGSREQRETYLRPLISGEALGAFSLSEPGSGSDAAALRCAAKKVPGGYRVSGTKMWCSSAGAADLYLLIARTGEHKTNGITAFIVPKDTPGFRVGKLEKKLGLRASPLAELIFEDAFVPDSQRLGAEGEGFKVALSQLDSGRISIGVVGLGIAAAAIETCWQRSVELERLGEPFLEGNRLLLAERYAELCAARSLAGSAYAAKDEGTRFTALASQVKLLGSDLAVRTTSEAITILGHPGYCEEWGVERMLRDAKALQIVEGTNQIQRLVLARELEKQLT